MRRREYFSELRQDLVFGLRQLSKNPGFTIVAILTLALGVGGTTAIFSAVNAVVLRPVPVAEPDRLVYVFSTWRDLRSRQRLARELHRVARAEHRLLVDRGASGGSASI